MICQLAIACVFIASRLFFPEYRPRCFFRPFNGAFGNIHEYYFYLVILKGAFLPGSLAAPLLTSMPSTQTITSCAAAPPASN
jgi:hypothetical protein